jgi:ribosome maturation factor RimP
MAAVHDKERKLYREVAPTVESAIPGVEVLALELAGPERFVVFVDHPQGVDHALCERVTDVLRPYLREYAVDVSSPGTERPLTKPEHFRRFVGRRARVRTRGGRAGSDSRRSFTGELLGATEDAVTVAADTGVVSIAYADIRRSNLVGD